MSKSGFAKTFNFAVFTSNMRKVGKGLAAEAWEEALDGDHSLEEIIATSKGTLRKHVEAKSAEMGFHPRINAAVTKAAIEGFVGEFKVLADGWRAQRDAGALVENVTE